MINLLVTPQDDNLVTFLVKIFKQGANILTNHLFGTDTVWAKTGDWTISDGVAKYTYVDDEFGSLSQDVTAESALYVFEYEVTNVSGTGYSIILDSSPADSVIVSDVTLDLTRGKHAVNVRLVSSGDKFYIFSDNFGSSDHVFLDNMSLRKINDEIRASSKSTFTVDSVVYSSGLLFQDYETVLGDISKISQVSTAGALENFEFSITDFSSYFIDDLYPNEGEPDLSGCRVELYAVWNNLTYASEAEMLLLNTYYINENNYLNNKMTFLCIETMDIEQEEIIKYFVQKDFDDGISYYPYAEKEVFGTPIPTIYGSFNVWNPVPNTTTGVKQEFVLTEIIMVNPANLEFVVCSHSVYTNCWNKHGKTGDTNIIFKYIQGINNYMMIFKIGDVTTSYDYSISVFKFRFMYTVSRMYGDLKIQFKQISSYTKQTAVENAIDEDPTTYSQIDRFEITATNLLALTIDGKTSTSEVGYLSSQAGEIHVVFAIKLEDNSTGNYRTGTRNNSLTTPANYDGSTTFSMAGATVLEKVISISERNDNKADPTLPWTIEELLNLEFFVVNYGADTVGMKINVYYGYLDLKNINVTGFTKHTRGYGHIATPSIRGTGVKVLIMGGFRR